MCVHDLPCSTPVCWFQHPMCVLPLCDPLGVAQPGDVFNDTAFQVFSRLPEDCSDGLWTEDGVREPAALFSQMW